jgi:hypothetical protein
MVVLRLDKEAVFGRQRESRRAQLREPRHCQFSGAYDFRLPTDVKIFQPKQLDFGGQDLLLNRKQRRDLDVMRMQIDFDYRIVEDLKSDKSHVLNGKGHAIVIGFRISQCRAKLGAVLKHPRPLGGNKHRQAVHENLSGPYPDNFPEITDFIPSQINRR